MKSDGRGFISTPVACHSLSSRFSTQAIILSLFPLFPHVSYNCLLSSASSFLLSFLPSSTSSPLAPVSLSFPLFLYFICSLFSFCLSCPQLNLTFHFSKLNANFSLSQPFTLDPSSIFPRLFHHLGSDSLRLSFSVRSSVMILLFNSLSLTMLSFCGCLSFLLVMSHI